MLSLTSISCPLASSTTLTSAKILIMSSQMPLAPMQSLRTLNLRLISLMMKKQLYWRFLVPSENKSVTKESWSSPNFKIMTAPKIVISPLSSSDVCWRSSKSCLHLRTFTNSCWGSISMLEILEKSTTSSSAPTLIDLRIFSLNTKPNTPKKRNLCYRANLEMPVTPSSMRRPRILTLSTIGLCKRELSSLTTPKILKIDLELQSLWRESVLKSSSWTSINSAKDVLPKTNLNKFSLCSTSLWPRKSSSH